jgi:hypothetical protein
MPLLSAALHGKVPGALMTLNVVLVRDKHIEGPSKDHLDLGVTWKRRQGRKVDP